ncbi:NmrA/HSCARG family protein [Foetidibacter luteolus]|uniref:NmrA/HSCARG family protein n=1 Tax=Foetidibacter luteolus TaxID=2608880 RepID=UPI00129BF3E5|nr:NmrA/HSCARG family protein [Foetidibacter luteolus]
MSHKPTILVTGATGAQGGSVANALLAGNQFNVRVLTRYASSAKAVELKAAGAEIAEGDFEDPASLLNAMKGCYGVFGVTNFWEHFHNEYRQGRNLINAVHQSGIKHFVFHTLRHYGKLSNGELPVPHCDIKADLQDYCNALGVPATFVQIGFYYENFFSFFPFQKDDSGSYYFGFPQGDTKLAAASVEDTGGVVASIFNHPDVYIGRTVGIVGADKTCAEYAAIFSKILGRHVYFNHIPRDVYASFGFPGAEELANMFEVQRLYIPNRQLDLIESYGLNPAMQSFESWVAKNKDRFDAWFASAEKPEPVSI